MKTITVKDALKLENSIFVDVRSPKEFEESSVPNSVNLPVLLNEERHMIGILYKQKGSNEAIAKGHELFNKRIEAYLKEFEKYSDRNIVVYCARGGMRSKVVTELLDKNGYNCFQMVNGYKEYRNYVLDKISNYKINFKLVVLHGQTGAGKTELLLKTDLPMIDLEGIAQHRSSSFGAVGLKPRKQKMFENILFSLVEKFNNEKVKYVLIEGESRKVGDCIIPNFLFDAMKKGIHVNVKCSLKSRVDRIVKEYFNSESKIKQVEEVVPKFKQILGKKVVEQLLEMVEKKEFDSFSEYFLVNYYDKKYNFTLDEIKYDYEINSDNIENALVELKKRFKK